MTGCVFKQYVYSGQDTKRIAPLILSSNVRWEPNDDQIRSLVADGHLAAGSPLAVAVNSRPEDRTSQTVMVLATLFVLILLMVVWGRAQREERDRLRLRRRVSEVPELKNELVGSYSERYDNPYESETDVIIDRYSSGR